MKKKELIDLLLKKGFTEEYLLEFLTDELEILYLLTKGDNNVN